MRIEVGRFSIFFNSPWQFFVSQGYDYTAVRMGCIHMEWHKRRDY